MNKRETIRELKRISKRLTRKDYFMECEGIILDTLMEVLPYIKVEYSEGVFVYSDRYDDIPHSTKRVGDIWVWSKKLDALEVALRKAHIDLAIQYLEGITLNKFSFRNALKARKKEELEKVEKLLAEMEK